MKFMFLFRLNVKMFAVQNLLELLGHTDHIYNAMQHEDIAETVVAVKERIERSRIVPPIENNTKSELTSTDYRQQGNRSFKKNMFRTVLECYNLALAYAPLNSQAMALAYSNRSALLFTVRAYGACLKDIEACLAIGGIESSIIDKLAKRKGICQRLSSSTDTAKLTAMFGKYFQFDVPRHPQIPSASTDVEVVMESEGPKVVAARDIKVGTVVAIEESFVSHLGKGNYFVACYYCHKMSLNLIPCEGCCAALFCDEVCLKRCNEEFHNIECQFIDSLESISTGAPSRMKVKAVLKMRQKCKSWSELIAASKIIGAERMKNSSINEIYDVNNKFSLLNFNNTKHFLFGEAFNASFESAVVISWLEKIKGFFPESPYERKQAVRAVARIMMQTYMFQVGLQVHTSANDQATDKVRWQKFCNWGWFSFMGKLKHACDANLIQLGLKNDVALTALHDIKKGTELSISYL